jgi:hypothetical protein
MLPIGGRSSRRGGCIGAGHRWSLYREWSGEALSARMHSRIILDGRNALDRTRLARFGFRYVRIAC